MKLLELVNEITKNLPNKGDVSDGYHTFNELYDHRIVLYIALCKQIHDDAFEVWRSKLHSDGSSFQGWFIMGINSDNGKQITYHLPVKYWDLCSFANDYYKAPDFDGHTSDDVLKRLLEL